MPQNRVFAKDDAQRRQNSAVLSGFRNILYIPYLFSGTNVVHTDY